MSRYHSYINSAKEILSQYDGSEPFASFLKKFFSQHKKYGSKDRKEISHVCYCYFRLGKSILTIPIEERILTGLLLCSTQPNAILQELKPGWNEKVALPAEEKLSLIDPSASLQNIFSWQHTLSSSIDAHAFSYSHLRQPDLFLRLRPGKEMTVQQKLTAAGISFENISKNCLALPNASKIDTIIEIDKEAVVQDYSSQKVGELLQNLQPETTNLKLSIWDCCAASGGKSIMIQDILSKIDLTVSDIRESILANLKKRFIAAGIKEYKSMVVDLSQPIKPGNNYFDLIVADVPCSGSGTWGRVPEQLVFFEDKKIEEYAALQKKIITNILPALKPGGYLLYITCSVFEKENEAAINFIKEKFHLELIKMEFLKGYTIKADTMFAALLRKP